MVRINFDAFCGINRGEGVSDYMRKWVHETPFYSSIGIIRRLAIVLLVRPYSSANVPVRQILIVGEGSRGSRSYVLCPLHRYRVLGDAVRSDLVA